MRIKKFMKALLIGVVISCVGLFITSCGKAKDKVENMTTLSDPTGFSYDIDTSKISWEFVTNADYYLVSFEEGTETKVYTNSVSYSSVNDQFTMNITAKSDGIFLDSNTVSMTFAKLSSDITLSVTNEGKVTWNEVSGATGYEIMVDGKTAGTVPTPVYDAVEPGSAHNLKVKPIKESTSNVYYYSSWSSAVSVNKLGTTTVDSITYNDGIIKWQAVASASKYKISINGQDFETTKNEYVYNAAKEGFNVTIQALGNHESTYDGAVSTQKSFVYLSMVKNITIENGSLVWEEVEKATSYQIKLNSNATPVATTIPAYSNLTSGTQYSISIIPVGSGENTTYFSEWSEPLSVYILPAPQLSWTANVDVDGTDNVNAINWNIINQAAGYSYHVVLPNGQEDEGTLGSLNNFYSSAFAETGTYVIKVKATSDGSAGIYDSAYSEPITVNRLEAPLVSSNDITSTANSLVSGFTINFDRVAGATGYSLYQNGTSIQTNTQTQFRVTNIVEESNTREVSIAYYVRSMGSISSDGKTVTLSSIMGSSSSSSSFSVTVLATPTSPTIAGTNDYSAIYSFTGVSHGYGYNLNIGGKNFTASDTNYNLDNAINEGTYEVRVCAQGNGHEVLASTYSTPISVTRLTAPYNLKIATDESDGALSFNGDNLAESYMLSITGRTEALPVDQGTNIKEYITTQATIVHMYSIANRFADAQETIYYMTSKASSNYEFIKLEAPSNINFDDNNMSWNSPSNLNNSSSFIPTYKILDATDNTSYNGDFRGQSYPLSNFEAGTYSFKIIAVGDGTQYINSDAAESREIRKLATPRFTVNSAERRYEWNSVAGAVNYILQIDGNIVSTDIHEAGALNYYIPTYETLGNHNVILYASGDGGNTTINSSPFEYTQVVEQLTTPEFAYQYGADAYDPTAKITVGITKPALYATGYNYVIGGTEHFSSEEQYEFNPNTAGAISIFVYAKGGGFDANGVYYSDSRRTTTSTLTLLGYPSMNNENLSKDGVLTWGSVTGASGYIYKLTITTTDNQTYTIEGVINTNRTNLELDGLEYETIGGEKAILSYNTVMYLTVELQAKGTLSANTDTTTNASVSSEKTTVAWTSALHE